MSKNECVINSFNGGGAMTKELKTLGIDLAKNRFQLHGREVSAWLGLTPKQNSSGNKIRSSCLIKNVTESKTLLIRCLKINAPH